MKRRFLAKKRRLALLGCAAILALALGAGGAALFSDDGARHASALRGQATGQMPEAIVVVAEPTGKAGESRLVLLRPHGDPRILGDVANYTAVAISPDGTTVAALVAPLNGAAEDAYVLLAPTGTGEVRRVALRRQDVPTRLSWSPDSSSLGVDGGVTAVVAPGGHVLRAGEVAPVGPQGVAIVAGGFGWSPDGRRFTSIVNGELRVVDVAAGQGTAWSLRQLLGTAADPAVFFSGYTSDGSPVLSVPGVGDPKATRLNGTALPRLEPVTQSAITAQPIVNAVGVEQVAVGALVERHPGASVLRARRAADGNAVIVELVRGAEEGVLVLLSGGKEDAAFDVTGVGANSLGGQLYDGWVKPASAPR